MDKLKSNLPLNKLHTYLFKATEDMFHGDASLSSSGGLSVAIPGEIKGYAKAKEMFGNPAVSWESLIQPSIELARKGIPVTFSKARCHISIFDDRKIFFLFIDGRIHFTGAEFFLVCQLFF